MKLSRLIPPLLCALPLAAQAPEKVNRDAQILADFDQRAKDYAKLHKTARAEVHGLKPTKSAEEIEQYEHRLERRIRELRAGAKQSDIFAPEIAAEFRRLIRITMQGAEAERIRESLRHAAPVRLPALRVNSRYPDELPLQSTPPSLLQNLPLLSPEVEYQVVGHDLALRDTEANLIVDYIPNAIP